MDGPGTLSSQPGPASEPCALGQAGHFHPGPVCSGKVEGLQNPSLKQTSVLL